MSCCGPQNCRDFDHDREGVSDDDLARFGGDDVSCPNCGAAVYHDAPMCHACGLAITDRAQRAGRPRWLPLAAIATLIAFTLGYVVWAL